MFDQSLFKEVVTEILPESLMNQLAPHLDVVLSRYEREEVILLQMQELDYLEMKDRQYRYKKIRAEFLAKNDVNWPAYAQSQWPEIGDFFNLQFENDENSFPF